MSAGVSPCCQVKVVDLGGYGRDEPLDWQSLAFYATMQPADSYFMGFGASYSSI